MSSSNGRSRDICLKCYALDGLRLWRKVGLSHRIPQQKESFREGWLNGTAYCVKERSSRLTCQDSHPECEHKLEHAIILGRRYNGDSLPWAV